jgi:succinylglutamate desuccinylase
MKYRMLSAEELVPFEEDLKQFLIVNGVHGDEWEQMNRDTPEKAIELVELFSDTVLQKVYEKIMFLEFRSVDSCLVFHCLSDRSLLIAIQHTQPDLDLSTPESIHAALTGELSRLNFFRSEKMHQHSREEEVHRLFEQGCVPSDEAFWNALVAVVSKTEV